MARMEGSERVLTCCVCSCLHPSAVNLLDTTTITGDWGWLTYPSHGVRTEHPRGSSCARRQRADADRNSNLMPEHDRRLQMFHRSRALIRRVELLQRDFHFHSTSTHGGHCSTSITSCSRLMDRSQSAATMLHLTCCNIITSEIPILVGRKNKDMQIRRHEIWPHGEMCLQHSGFQSGGRQGALAGPQKIGEKIRKKC